MKNILIIFLLFTSVILPQKATSLMMAPRSGSFALSWHGGDPDGDIVTYSVYFGKDSVNIPLVSTTQDSFYVINHKLNYNTTYFWKVIATDEHGESTSGELWRFTTIERHR